jgi:hypothetical protein
MTRSKGTSNETFPQSEVPEVTDIMRRVLGRREVHGGHRQLGDIEDVQEHDEPPFVQRPGKEHARDDMQLLEREILGTQDSIFSTDVSGDERRPTENGPVTYTNRILISVIHLPWGGEFVQNPPQVVFGQVIHRVTRTEGPSSSEGVLLVCDFGGELGIQSVLEKHCTYVGSAVVNRVLDDNTSDDDCSKYSGFSWSPDWKDLEHWEPTWDDPRGDDYSSGGSDEDDGPEDRPSALLGELGMYPFGPHPENEDFLEKYGDANWHARTWSLLPREQFRGPQPGPTTQLGTGPMTPGGLCF